MAGPLRGEGGGVKGRAIKETKMFNLFFQRSNIPTAIKLERGGGGGGGPQWPGD